MGFDYALVSVVHSEKYFRLGSNIDLSHLKYNVPPAIALTWLYLPLFTKLNLYKILFLIIVGTLRLFGEPQLNVTDCGGFDHTMGLLFDPQAYMVLPSRCDPRAQLVRHTCRRALLLRDPDIQHIFTLSYP